MMEKSNAKARRGEEAVVAVRGRSVRGRSAVADYAVCLAVLSAFALLVQGVIWITRERMLDGIKLVVVAAVVFLITFFATGSSVRRRRARV